MEKLQRQRALLHEHLRWLESEIAAEASSVAPQAASREMAPPTVPVPHQVTAAASTAPTTIPGDSTAQLPEADVRGIHSEVRSGCLLYFAIAVLGLGAVVAFIYLRY